MKRKRDQEQGSDAETPASKEIETLEENEPTKQVKHDSNNAETKQLVYTQIQYIDGNLFEAAPGSILVHSCNCRGIWGKGVAKDLKLKYPDHYRRQEDYCKRKNPEEIIGTTLLLSPEVAASGRRGKDWIACLFTRKTLMRAFGKPAPAEVEGVIEATKTAMQDLYKQMDDQKLHNEIVMPKINSGLFKTPWKKTVDALQSVRVPHIIPNVVKVYDPSGK